MADGHFPTLVSKDRNVNASTNPLYTQLTDGTDLALIDGSGNLQVLVNNGAGASAVNIQDGGNSITVDGSVSITGSVTVTATDLDIRDLSHTQDSVKVGDGTDFLAIAADGSIAVTDNGASLTVDAVNLDIRDLTHVSDSVKVGDGTDLLAVNTDGSINVNIVTASLSDEVQDYNTAASVASDTASNHDYTVANTTFILSSIIFACSGAGKVEVRVGPLATLVTKAVAFIPKQGGHVQLNFNPAIEVPSTSTGTIRVARTNREGAAQDVYSTIIGRDI